MSKRPVALDSSMEEIDIAVRSGSPYIWVRTFDEARFIEDYNTNVAEPKNQDLYVWSLAQGIVPAANYENGRKADGVFEGTHQPPKAIQKIADLQKKKSSTRNVVIMRDPGVIMQEPIPRMLRDSYALLRKNKTVIIFLAPTLTHGAGGTQSGIFPTLDKQVTVIDYNLPTRSDLEKILKESVFNVISNNDPAKKKTKEEREKLKAIIDKLKYTDEQWREFATALQGLTKYEAEAAVNSCILAHKGLDITYLLKTKKQLINKSEILEYCEHTKSMNDIGGMDLAKAFFEDYKLAHTEEAKEFGIEPLRGILFVGVPGCGKSQSTKALAKEWNQPLLRLDIGKVMTGLVGGSEAKMREVIKQAEAISPCILWIDEIEKALSGTKSSNFSDGGTMARVFGTLLTAMEEGLDGVTIVATANDISMLPPELIRRFSEVFFVDLPGPEERKEIFSIHLTRRGRGDTKALKIDLDLLAEKTDGFTGHEIEKAVQRSLAFAFKSQDKKLTTEHISRAIDETKPISKIMGDKIEKMREEARGKYRYASSHAQANNEKRNSKRKEMSLDSLELPSAEAKKAEVNNSGIDLDDL